MLNFIIIQKILLICNPIILKIGISSVVTQIYFIYTFLFCLEWTLVAKGRSCTGSLEKINGLETLDECALKCKGMISETPDFTYFIHGVRCQGEKCECACNTKGKCDINSGSKWNLYKYAKEGKENYIIHFVIDIFQKEHCIVSFVAIKCKTTLIYKCFQVDVVEFHQYYLP